MYPVILFEGLDHTGKSTIAEQIARELHGVIIHSPARELTPFRKYFDSLGNEENFAYYLTGNHAVDLKISHLRKKRIVIADRHFFSTVAYHSPKLGKNIDYILKGMKNVPDIIYYFTATIAELEKRTHKSGKVNERFHGARYWKEVEAHYQRIFEHYPQVRIVDTTGKTLEQVYQFILKDIRLFLHEKAQLKST